MKDEEIKNAGETDETFRFKDNSYIKTVDHLF